MAKRNLEALRKMYVGARSRGSETVNPVDRFIMLVRVRQSTIWWEFSNMLNRSGMPDLLRAVLKGRYDFLGGGEGMSEGQVKTREKVCVRMLLEMKVAEEVDRTGGSRDAVCSLL